MLETTFSASEIQLLPQSSQEKLQEQIVSDSKVVTSAAQGLGPTESLLSSGIVSTILFFE